ncbi:MAG: lipoyl synthase [Desulfobacterales bacterium]|nr:lipoyl synthase [Desulfobacterales bacterium]
MPNPSRTPKPPWLRRRLPTGPVYEKVRAMIASGHLHTVCQEAHCPNQWECFSHHTATFLLLGDRCTRNCRFCAVAHGPQGDPDPNEPDRVAKAAAAMNLRYVVVTSVTRDDLPDGGASIFADTIRAIRKRIEGAKVEVLIPDFQGNAEALKTVLEAEPDVLNHNLETVSRLYPTVRPEANYEQSLALIKRVSDWAPQIPAKSGLMLGLGETAAEIQLALADLQREGCRLLTLGQYLQPTKANLPVYRFVPPEEFDQWKEIALDLGFHRVASGPFVRSSYHAEDMVKTDSGEGNKAI